MHSSCSVKKLEQKLSADLGNAVKLEPISDATFKKDVPDSTDKYRCQASNGSQYFLLVSSAGNPTLVKRAADNIMQVRKQVTEGVAASILEPVATGVSDNFTYAAWPLKKPFPTSGRIKKFISRRRFTKPVLDWHMALTCETMREADQTVCSDNLQRILEDDFPDEMKKDATLALDRLHAGDWRPFNSYQHGDFWVGNIVLPIGADEPEFYIIDWAGMQSHGYPFLDLVRMLVSLRCKTSDCRAHIETLRQHIDCHPVDVTSYALCGLGHLGRNLEHFPPDRFRASAVKVYSFTKLHTTRLNV